MALTERQRKILQAIVEDYVATAEPVGSRTIARKYGLGVSPATIRNDMADLEEIGLLEQPYTSAGRIPSDQGYRYYVDQLMEKGTLSRSEQGYVLQRLHQRARVAEIAEGVTRVLAEVTHLTSLFLGPIWGGSVLQQVRLLPLSEDQALLVIFTSMGAIEHALIDLVPPVSTSELDKVSAIINNKLSGRTLDDVNRVTWQEIGSELARHRQLANTILEAVDEVLKSDVGRRVYLGGTLNIIEQPEFRDGERLRSMLSVLEREDLLYEVLTANIDENIGGNIEVTIGSENRHASMQECSLVTATYRVEGKVIGTIGILGPTRMQYARAVRAVEYVSGILSKALAGR